MLRPKKGETLFVSGAAGAIGTVVGQIGKILVSHRTYFLHVATLLSSVADTLVALLYLMRYRVSAFENSSRFPTCI